MRHLRPAFGGHPSARAAWTDQGVDDAWGGSCRSTLAPDERALSHLAILDFSHLLRGPFATRLLADAAANVIEVERPGKGDLFRSTTFRDKWLGGSESPDFLAGSRNKRSLALDLKTPGAREVVMETARAADVVVQDFHPGVMARLGYDDVEAVNPRLVSCSGSGCGDDGPYVGRPGQDLPIGGLTGIISATGRADQAPTPVGAGFSDQAGAISMVYGILTALLGRERSGPGQEVKVNLLAGMLAHQNQEMVMAMNFGIGHPGIYAPTGVYPTTDGWVTIAMSPFRTLVGVLGAPDLLRHDDPASLYEKRDEVWRALAAETGKWARRDLMAAMLATDIWCGEARTHLQAEQDPQARRLGLVQTCEHPVAGTVKAIGPSVRWSEAPAAIERPAPLVGQPARGILSGLGLGPEEIDALIAAGAAGEPPA